MATLQEYEIVSLIALGSTGILALIIGIAVFLITYQRRMLKAQVREQQREKEYQQRMIQMQLESQEAERKRIAADLHDSVGSLLWGAKLAAAYLDRSGENDIHRTSLHNELMDILDQSIHTVKQITWELTPEAFQYSGLSASVATLCKRFDGKGMAVQFDENQERIWKGNEALLVFRVIQELLSNSIKHAKADRLTIRFGWEKEFLTVEAIDDGVGLQLGEQRNGVGWWNIQQRVKLLKATIEVVEVPIGTGTHVKLQIPLPYEG